MKGLELARAYYEAHGKQMIRASFPQYEDRIAAGLVGQGSECFGFDDELSTDHDFGPSFCLWLTSEDYRAIGKDLRKAYNDLPGDFMGFPARRESDQGGGRVGVQEIGVFYRGQIGRADAPSHLLEWLAIPELRLATVTNGQVFQDPLGEFSQTRNALLRFYPEDVRIKKIAARAAAMGQSGQYNYARCMCRRETVAAQLALAEFVQQAISMVFLLNRKYAPFYKWMHKAMQELPSLAHLSHLLRELSTNGLHPDAWESADGKKVLKSLNMRDRNVAIIETICKAVKEQLQNEGLTDSDNDFLATQASEIMARIKDARLKAMHILEG